MMPFSSLFVLVLKGTFITNKKLSGTPRVVFGDDTPAGLRTRASTKRWVTVPTDCHPPLLNSSPSECPSLFFKTYYYDALGLE
jgi:hypothetical protein